MASMVVGGLFNAVAFAGAGFLFSHFNKHGYGDEIKRHNLAMEELSIAKETAKQDSKDTNSAFMALNSAEKSNTYSEPQLEDYYTPSDEMKKYQNIAIGVVGVGTGALASFLV